MNLMQFIARGQAHAPTDDQRTAEKLRALWLNALMVDQTRAWLSVDEESQELLNAMASILIISCMVLVFDQRKDDTPDIRVIRGAVSAATQRSQTRGAITADDVRAFSSACARAAKAIENGSVAGILHANKSMRSVVGLDQIHTNSGKQASS